MSEELKQKGLMEHGLKIGPYEFYSIGATTIRQLKAARVIPNKEYAGVSSLKPDALLVDRRNKARIKVIAVIEYKDTGKFKSNSDRLLSVRQCNDLCAILGAEVGIATDTSTFIWFNPKQKDAANTYESPALKKGLSFSWIMDEKSEKFTEPFAIDQKSNEQDTNLLTHVTQNTIRLLELVRKHISTENSAIVAVPIVDPSALAKQIWQDVWSVSGATPEKCLYTFVEMFIFKYLSDLGILDEDDRGNKISFSHLITLEPAKAFKNYTANARRHLKSMFPESTEDGTTIINGTVLNPSVAEHGEVFAKILRKFEDFGPLRNIDPSFKSRLFEDFMKESISKKNWGQFFTPRNIIDAIVQISGIESLPDGSNVCDPACGVGGFILEPMKIHPQGPKFYYTVSGSRIKPRHKFTGFDKGFEKEEQLTVILAKANMLIFLSELLVDHGSLSRDFAALFNSTFRLLHESILGTLALTKEKEYDLIMSNPPYVSSGSSNYKDAIKKNSELASFYAVSSLGVEGLFVEWIIRALKPGGRAFIILPHGALHRIHDDKLRSFMKEECYLDAIISLPINSFYTTPQKTYIIALTKKLANSANERRKLAQSEPVFTYIVSEIGETLDINRFRKEANDLNEMVSLFNQFKGAKSSFMSSAARCKVQPISKFRPEDHWCVDRWWSKDERVALMIEEQESVLSTEEFLHKIQETATRLKDVKTALNNCVKPEGHSISLQVSELFDLSHKTNRSHFTKEFVNNNKGTIPVYSASKNPNEVSYGYVKDNLKDVKYFEDILTWNIDGSIGKAFFREGRFTLSEKVIPLILRQEYVGKIDLVYIKYCLERKATEAGFSFSNKAGKSRISGLVIDIPASQKGNKIIPDAETQRVLANQFEQFYTLRDQLVEDLEELRASTLEL